MQTYTIAINGKTNVFVFLKHFNTDEEVIQYASDECRDPRNEINFLLIRRGDARAHDPVFWDSRKDKHAEPVSPEIVTCYEVQGMYKDRGKTTRSWQCWVPCESIEDARAAYTNGLKLKNRVSDGGFTDLRIVQIEKHITVLEA